jgi:carbamoyltransferase
VLGIGPGIKLGHHDSSATLIKNGEIVAACEEERFYCDKKARAKFPKKAIDFCLKEEGIKINDVNYIASPLITYVNYKKRIELLFEFHYGYSPKIELHHHHLCHAASSYYLSGYDDALVLTADYSGDSASGMIAHGEKNKLRVIKYFDRKNSLGSFYSMITQYLGFEAHSDEYKVMGLASYGEPKYLNSLKKIITVKNGEPHFDISYHRRFAHPEIYTTDFTTFQEMSFDDKLIDLLGQNRKPEEKILKRHKNIAASLQKLTEEIILQIIEESGIVSDNLCLAGGIALNCKLNYEIIKTGKYKGIFIQPASGDAGVSLGAAILSSLRNGVKTFKNDNIVYLGPSYDNETIKKYLDLCKLNYTYVECPEKIAAEMIAQQKIVGWFQGKSEFGPRALGNRSILANPTIKEMKDIVNNSVKFREEFRPFAPAVLEEVQDKYFRNCVNDPYMVTLADVTEYAKKSIPAVVHCDNTSRIQSVSKKRNELFWRLINNLGKITGEKVVLNTSLNLNGQPLAARLSEAVKVFYSSGMDCIFLGNYLLQKVNK